MSLRLYLDDSTNLDKIESLHFEVRPARWTPGIRDLTMAQNVDGRKVKAALVVTVPEAEELVGRCRSEYDPAATRGMPTHITINSPFIPGVKPSADTLSRLSKLFAAIQPFAFTLDHIARFPNVVYLAPMPSAPFVQLIDQTAHEFPESPPYGGRFDSITPHLTVAHSRDSNLLVSVERKLSVVASDQLPLNAFADHVWLMDDSDGRWEKRAFFSLGAR